MKSHILHSYNTSNIDEEFTERCKDYNILPTIIPHKRRVIGIGDIHGDMNLAINFLKKAKVIKEICKNYFADKKIKEHRYKLRLHTNILDHDIINNDFDNLMKAQ